MNEFRIHCKNYGQIVELKKKELFDFLESKKVSDDIVFLIGNDFKKFDFEIFYLPTSLEPIE